jgi:hypothetical protein
MLVTIINLGLSALAAADCSLVLLVVEIPLILNVHIAAQVIGQLARLIDLDNEIYSLIKEFGGLFRDEFEIISSAAVWVNRDNIHIQLAVYFISRPNQIDSGWVVDQVSECLQTVVAFANQQWLWLVNKWILVLLTVTLDQVTHHNKSLSELFRRP